MSIRTYRNTIDDREFVFVSGTPGTEIRKLYCNHNMITTIFRTISGKIQYKEYNGHHIAAVTRFQLLIMIIAQ